MEAMFGGVWATDYPTVEEATGGGEFELIEHARIVIPAPTEPKCTPECDALHQPGAPAGLARSWHADNCPVPVHHHADMGETDCGKAAAELPPAHGYETGSWAITDCADCLKRKPE